ncbi:optic atrophy 3 protein-domain-containing protein [Melampsora americana]|nr:optic atrophy 3 protein-domain-containing protein [Melampsora americana]
MATIKVFSLLIKTLSKPIANSLKSRAQDHPQFRKICVGVAQSLHRYETRLASGIFSKIQPTIRPLSDTKAIQNGANFLSEAFLFTVALGLIVGENLRGRIQTANRRDKINERLEELEQSMAAINSGQIELKTQLTELIKSHQEVLRDPRTLLQDDMKSHSIRGFGSTPDGLRDDELVKRAEIALGWRTS